MEPAAILHEFTNAEDLPREALRAASARRADMVPLFIERIESWVAGSSADDDVLFFAFYLLGSWKATAAYRPLARLLRCPSERVDAALGWSITESSHQVMAAVFDGDPAPLYNIILDDKADEYVRSRMCETLAMLVVEGRLDRAEVAAFLRDCWINLQPRDGCFVWNGWQSAIAMLGLVELKDIVKHAFDTKVVDERWLAYHHFESDLEHAVANPREPWPRSNEYAPLGDIIEELSGWHGFSEEFKAERERARNAPPRPLFPSQPASNPLRGVGRNHPCPCGSGRKYKKCCLQ